MSIQLAPDPSKNVHLIGFYVFVTNFKHLSYRHKCTCKCRTSSKLLPFCLFWGLTTDVLESNFCLLPERFDILHSWKLDCGFVKSCVVGYIHVRFLSWIVGCANIVILASHTVNVFESKAAKFLDCLPQINV